MNIVLSFIVSVAVAKQTSRSDLSSSLQIKPKAAGWGSFSSWTYCNAGKFAKAFHLKVLGSQGSGDDYGATGFQLECSDSEILNAGNDIDLGTYSRTTCNTGAFIRAVQTKVQSPQGSGVDDTALNSVAIMCTDRVELGDASSGQHGTWGAYLSCPYGSVVCGFRQRVESKINGDNTGLNSIELACCKNSVANTHVVKTETLDYGIVVLLDSPIEGDDDKYCSDAGGASYPSGYNGMFSYNSEPYTWGCNSNYYWVAMDRTCPSLCIAGCESSDNVFQCNYQCKYLNGVSGGSNGWSQRSNYKNTCVLCKKN